MLTKQECLPEDMMETAVPVQVSAPGRFILFGDHAPDYGEPAIAVAVDMRVKCTATLSNRFTVNGEPMEQGKHPHARAAVIGGWTDMDKPLALTLESGIPPGHGLGTEPATTVACLGAISMLHDHLIFEQVAKSAFDAFSEMDSSCSPLDTSVSAHGGAVMVDTSPGESTLWTVKSKRQIWHLSEVSLGNPEFVMGYSGRPSNASEMRAKLRRFHDRNSFARDLVRDLGKIPREGRLALEKNNPERIGELMNMSQKILQNLGLGTPELDKMIKAASRHSYGAKLTGGGGCMVALARDPGKAAEAIRGAGGTAILLQLAREGVRPED